MHQTFVDTKSESGPEFVTFPNYNLLLDLLYFPCTAEMRMCTTPTFF